MPYHHDAQQVQQQIDDEKEKIQKGTKDEHTHGLQWGDPSSANKSSDAANSSAASHTVPLGLEEPLHGADSRRIGCEPRQAQDQDSVDRVVPEVGYGPPPRSLIGPSTSTEPIVAAGEPQVRSPNVGGPASDQGISSAV